MEVAGADEAVEFGEAEMVRQAMVFHRDAFLLQGPVEIFFEDAAFAGHIFGKQFLDAAFFGVGDIDAIGVHPAPQAGQGLVAAERQHPGEIFARDQLPGGAQQVRADDPAFVEGFLEGLERRLPRPHRHGPAHRLILLRLHGAEPRDDVRRIFEFGGDELLAQETGGNGIHQCEDSDFRGFFLSLCYEQHRKSI